MMKRLYGLASISQALRYAFSHSRHSRRISQALLLNESLTQWHLRPRIASPAGPATKISLRYASSKSGLEHLKQNEEVDEVIQVVGENGLGLPTRSSEVLRTLDQSQYTLVQVAPASEGRAAVCKIMSKKEIYEQERAKAKAARAAKTSTKTLELNWAIDSHDLEHRLKQVRGFLEKGRIVEIIMTRKKGKRPPTEEEVQGLYESVMEMIEEEQAVETKAREGKLGQTLMLTIAKRKQ